MGELLEEIKKLSADEKYALAYQVLAWADEEQVFPEDPEWDKELERRVREAKASGFPGRPAEDALDEMERDLQEKRKSAL